MGFGLISIGFVFLFNPNINIIDVIPDFIGLWLICIGLTKIAQINADLMEARGLFFKLSIVELGKFASILLLDSQDATRYLLLAFIFGIIECILFVLAIRSFFIGVENLGMKFSSKSVLASYEKKTLKGKVKKDVSTRVSVTMIAFFFVRTICAIFPEFTELQDDSIISYKRVIYSNFKGIFYLLGIIIVVVFAVIYLKRTLSFFGSIRKDKDFIDTLKSSYNDFLTVNRNYHVSRIMKLVLVLYAIGAILTYSPTDDGLIKIPLILTAVTLIAISVCLSSVNKKALYAIIPAAITAVLSVIDFIKQDNFYVDNTKFEDVFHIETARESFNVISNLALVEYILIFVAFLYLTNLIFTIGRDHIPYALSKNSVTLTPNSDEVEEIRGKYNRYSTVITVLMAGSLILYGVLTKIAIIAGEQAAFIDKNDINVPSIIFAWLSVGTNALTVAWFAAIMLFIGFAKNRIYGCVYNWSVVSDK